MFPLIHTCIFLLCSENLNKKKNDKILALEGGSKISQMALKLALWFLAFAPGIFWILYLLLC